MSTTGTIAPLPTFSTTAELVASLQAAVQALNSLITNFNAGGVTETYLEAIASALGSDASVVTNGKIIGAYELLTQVQDAEFILTANGQYLDYKCADVGVSRKQAVAASQSTCIQFTSKTGPVASPQVFSPGTLVAAQVADPTIPPVVYRLTTTATMNVGDTVSTLASCVCVTAGSIGNQVSGAINIVVSGPSGFSVTNTLPISGGSDIEQDDFPNGGLRARGLAAIPNASQCTVAALKAAALSYAGITSANVKDLTATDGVTFQRGMTQIYCDDGSGNLGAATTTTAPFVIPALGGTVTVHVVNGVPWLDGQYGYITDGTRNMQFVVDTGGGTTALVVKNLAVISGNVGDTMLTAATVANPNNTALTQFQADLTAGKWRAAGTQAYAHGSVLLPVVISLSIDTNATYVATIATVAEVCAAVQKAIFDYVNGLPIGAPVVLAAVIDAAKNVLGVSNVLVTTVLINGVNGDLGIDGSGVVTMPVNQTPRCANLASITVTNNLTVPY